jgi:protein translocase SecG subunit
MTFLAGLLTLALIALCLLLIGLVLIQLPKKDAGAGLAFGAGAADALFGAGSGNALTNITKWSVVAFLLGCLVLGVIYDKQSGKTDGSDFAKQVQQKQQAAPAVSQQAPPATTATPTAPVVVPAAAVTATNAVK